jgi:hypothetical protein
MQNKAWRIVSIISLLVVVGCSSSDSSDSIVYRHLALVEKVEVRLLDEGNMELDISGYHRSGCQRLDGYDVSVGATDITVQLWAWQPDRDPNLACTPVAPPFNITITIDASELAPGQYDIGINLADFNSVSTTITLPNN